jgi:hypothetical protein
MALVPAQTHMPLRFMVGSLVEFAIDVSGRVGQSAVFAPCFILILLLS